MSSHEQDIEGLYRRYSLLWELDELLNDRVPKDVDRHLADPAILAEPDFLFLLTSLKVSYEKFQAVRQSIYDRIEEASWLCVTELYHIKRGDVLEVTRDDDTTEKFFAQDASPDFYSGGESTAPDRFRHFSIAGPNVLSTGLPGKRRSIIYTRHARWDRIKVNGVTPQL